MLRGAPKSLKGSDVQEQRWLIESMNKGPLLSYVWFLQLTELIHYHVILSDISYSAASMYNDSTDIWLNQIRQMKKNLWAYIYPNTLIMLVV